VSAFEPRSAQSVTRLATKTSKPPSRSLKSLACNNVSKQTETMFQTKEKNGGKSTADGCAKHVNLLASRLGRELTVSAGSVSTHTCPKSKQRLAFE
jgi:hypothetical protein